MQRCVKGIGGDSISEEEAKAVVTEARGIWSNWLRCRKRVSGADIRDVLTERNLDEHLHNYKQYGKCSPFISLTCGAVGREAWVQKNTAYSAVDTALAFATDNGKRPGALFYLWVPVAHNAVVPLASVAEPVRDLNIYQDWSPYQLEGEVTAKIHIAASQIECVEWWCHQDLSKRSWIKTNRDYVAPDRVTNIRGYF